MVATHLLSLPPVADWSSMKLCVVWMDALCKGGFDGKGWVRFCGAIAAVNGGVGGESGGGRRRKRRRSVRVESGSFD